MRAAWFDEAFDAAGQLRRPYASLRRRLGWNPLQPTSEMADRLRARPLADDTRIFPVPIVLDDDEYRLMIAAGVAQRARALRELFRDVILGSHRILGAGTGLTDDHLDLVAAAEGTTVARLRRLWEGRRSEDIRFVYGPDLVRDADGHWVVIEDNVGCVGGSADAHFVANAYRLAANLDGCAGGSSSADLLRATQRWLRQLGRTPSSAVAVLGCEGSDSPFGLRIDENARRRRILADGGVPVLGRTELEQQVGSRESTVGGVTVLNFDTDDTWVDLLRSPGVTLLNVPGTGVLGNKALLPYVEDIIGYYTGEEPILRTPHTVLLEDRQLPKGPEWVIKSTAGCQGTEVFILDWLSPNQRARLQAWVHAERPGVGVVAQRFIEPSRLVPSGSGGWDEYQIELRPVTYVLGSDEIHVSDEALGKVVSIYDPRRLNNISQGACYAAALREPSLRADG